MTVPLSRRALVWAARVHKYCLLCLVAEGVLFTLILALLT